MALSVTFGKASSLTPNARFSGVGFNIAPALGDIELTNIPALVKIDATFYPDPVTRKTYACLYAEFTKIYKSQRKMFRRLGHAG